MIYLELLTKVFLKFMKQKPLKQTLIYQAKNGAIELHKDYKKDSLWASINQIAEMFERDKSVISRHIKNIYKTNELKKSPTVAKIATVQKEGSREVIRNIEYYNLDMILSIGYRVDSKRATDFRIWATKVLKEYVVDGFAINKKQIAKNYEKFTKAISDIKILLPKNNEIDSVNILDLVSTFAKTWLSLDAYDKDQLNTKGITKKRISLDAKELEQGITKLKLDLIQKGEATEIFAKERIASSLEGIIGNVMQSFNGSDLYPTLEEKAAHLFYFIIKNHPFIDGNKRSGAFAFVWFLQKYNLLNTAEISPQALTAITLLIAESNPEDKEKMIGFVLLLLSKEAKTTYTIEYIQKIVARKFNIKIKDLSSEERKQPLVLYKQIAAYLVRKYTNASFPEIARAFGKNHATIIHSVNEINQKLANRNKNITSMVNTIEQAILNQNS